MTATPAAIETTKRHDPESVARNYLMNTIAELHLQVANLRAVNAEQANRIVEATDDLQKMRLERDAALARVPKT